MLSNVSAFSAPCNHEQGNGLNLLMAFIIIGHDYYEVQVALMIFLISVFFGVDLNLELG